VVGVVTRGDLRRAGLPPAALSLPSCVCCGSTEHVRLDPRSESMALCDSCLERARPPRFFEDVGGGD
jgi:hypothetical protein